MTSKIRRSYLVDDLNSTILHSVAVHKEIARLIKTNFDETVKRNPTLYGMYRAIHRDFFNDEISPNRY